MKLETIIKKFEICSQAFMAFQDSVVFDKLAGIIDDLKKFEQEYQALQQENERLRELLKFVNDNLTDAIFPEEEWFKTEFKKRFKEAGDED